MRIIDKMIDAPTWKQVIYVIVAYSTIIGVSATLLWWTI